MKTKEELQELRSEFEALNKKLAELTEDELKQVVGGVEYNRPSQESNYDPHIYFIDTDKDFE